MVYQLAAMYRRNAAAFRRAASRLPPVKAQADRLVPKDNPEPQGTPSGRTKSPAESGTEPHCLFGLLDA